MGSQLSTQPVQYGGGNSPGSALEWVRVATRRCDRTVPRRATPRQGKPRIAVAAPRPAKAAHTRPRYVQGLRHACATRLQDAAAVAGAAGRGATLSGGGGGSEASALLCPPAAPRRSPECWEDREQRRLGWQPCSQSVVSSSSQWSNQPCRSYCRPASGPRARE